MAQHAAKPRLPGYFLLTAFLPGHLFNWAVEWGYAACTTLLGMVLYRRFYRRQPVAAGIGLAVALFATYASLVGYTGTLALSGLPTGVRDGVDLLKPAMVFFSCTLGLVDGPPSLGQIRRACLLILGYAVACALILIYGVPGLASAVELLYGGTKTGFSEFFARLSIPFENPNFLGLLAVLSLIIALNFSARIDLPLALVSLAAAALSGSRTAWVTAALTVLFYLARLLWQSLSLSRLRHSGLPALVLAGALVAGLVYFAPALIEANQRVASFLELFSTFDLAADESYAERIALRDNAAALIAQRPFFGWGAVKYSSLDIIDSQYFGLLLRFGFVGSAVLLLAALALFVSTLRALRGTGYQHQAVFLWLITALWLWNGSFLENIRLAVLVVLLFVSITQVHAKPAP